MRYILIYLLISISYFPIKLHGQDDYIVNNISDEIFDEIEEISGASAAGGYSLPLGMKPKYFNSPMPKVKGINIYNGKKKK